MSYYYNGAGQRYELPERPLEPPDCWAPEEQISGPVLSFDPAAHVYRLDGKQVPSVTQLTSIFGPDSIQEGDSLELTMEAAAERGTVLHGYIEHRLNGGTREEYELPDGYAAYADGVDLFLAEHELDPMFRSTACKSPAHAAMPAIFASV